MALREVEGEALDSDEEEDIKDSDPFEAEGYRVGSPSGVGPSSQTMISTKSTAGAKRAKTGYGSAPSRDPRWYGTGGYTGLQGDPEAERAEKALQSKTEEERLRQENETLRELLRISGEITPEIAREFGIEIPAPSGPVNWPKLGANAGKLSLGKARGSRKSLVEATLPVKVNEAEEEGATQANSGQGQETLRTLDDTTTTIHDEPMDVDSTFSSSGPDPVPATVTGSVSEGEKTDTAVEKVIPTHVVQGSGGPPQLSSDVDGKDAGAKAGIVVTSQVSTSDDVEKVQEAQTAEDEDDPLEEHQGKPAVEPGMTQTKEEEPVINILAQEPKVDESAEDAAETDTVSNKAEARDRLLSEVQESLAESEEGEITITE